MTSLFLSVDLRRVTLQRLFSTFANGLPGKGLLLLRLAVSAFLISDIRNIVSRAEGVRGAVPEVGAAAAGLLLLVGLWTPIAGVLVFFLEILISVARAGDPGAHILAAAIALGLSLIGPGAWSVDARVFGRKRISIQG